MVWEGPAQTTLRPHKPTLPDYKCACGLGGRQPRPHQTAPDRTQTAPDRTQTAFQTAFQTADHTQTTFVV